jgi:hypothetical protein
MKQMGYQAVTFPTRDNSGHSVDSGVVNMVLGAMSDMSAAVAAVSRQNPYQLLSYAATLSIDPTLGAVVQVSALTGALTINAPLSPLNGDVLTICLKQDGTGGRVVTWNAIFVSPPTVATGANARTVATFVYSDSVWQ